MEGSTVLGTDDGRRHRSLELHADRACRWHAHPDRHPDRPGRQHRHGDAELHARQDGAGAEHRSGFGHRQFGERRDHLEPGDQGHRPGQHRRHDQGGQHRPRHDDSRRTGAWSFTPAGLVDGAHTLTATQTDPAGNTGTATLSFTLDKTAPALSIALVSDTGSSASDGITSNPAIKGTGQANTVVTIKEGSTVLGTTTADGTGAWSFTPAGLRRWRAHPDRHPDRPGRQHRHGDAELHARQDGAGAEHRPGFGHRQFGERRDHLEPGDQGHRPGQCRRHDQGGRTVLGTTTADGTGAWSFTPAGLVDGAHTLTATRPTWPATPARRR